jgi:hypothetical protein
LRPPNCGSSSATPGVIAQPLPPDALARRMRGDIETWAKVIGRMGIPQR